MTSIRVLISLVLSSLVIFTLAWSITYGFKNFVKTLVTKKIFIVFFILLVTGCHLKTEYPFLPYSQPSTPVEVIPGVYKYNNPVLVGSPNWEGEMIGEISSIYDNEENLFKTWYRGYSGWSCQLGYAYSYDGVTWFKNLTPILTNVLAYAYVLKLSNIYYLFAVDQNDNDLYRWSSIDGINWNINNSGNPILTNNPSILWENNFICNCAVIYDDEDPIYPWKMLYEASGDYFQIGYAYSSDGLSWTKYSGNPVITKSINWKSFCVGNPDLIKINGIYYCVYGGSNGTNWSIGGSYSTNLIDWTDSTNSPFIEPTLLWENTNTSDPSVIIKSGVLFIYYSANQTKPCQGLVIVSNIILENFLN